MERYGEGSPAGGVAAQRGTPDAGAQDVAGQAQQMAGQVADQAQEKTVARVEATVRRERLQVATTGPVDVVDVAEDGLSGIRRPKGTEDPGRAGLMSGRER